MVQHSSCFVSKNVQRRRTIHSATPRNPFILLLVYFIVVPHTQFLANITAHGWTAEWIPLRTSNDILPPRSGHVAFTLKDNQVYVFGGYAEEEEQDPRQKGITPPVRYPVNDLWALDAVSHTWKCVHETDLWSFKEENTRSVKTIPQQRLAAAAVGLSSKAIVLGGWDSQEAGTGGVVLNSIDVFVPADERMTSPMWKMDPSINLGEPTSRLVAVPLSDTIVLVHNHRCTDHVLLVELIDDESQIQTRRQQTTGRSPSPRGLHAAAVCRSSHTKVVFFGGAAQSGEMSNELHVLDTTTWKWEEIQVTGHCPSPRASPCLCLLEDSADSISKNEATFVLFGGADRSLVEEGVPLHGCNDLWLLRLSFEDQCITAKWEHVPTDSLPPGRNAATLTPLPNERYTFVLQGGWYPFRITHRETYLLKLTKE